MNQDDVSELSYHPESECTDKGDGYAMSQTILYIEFVTNVDSHGVAQFLPSKNSRHQQPAQILRLMTDHMMKYLQRHLRVNTAQNQRSSANLFSALK